MVSLTRQFQLVLLH